MARPNDVLAAAAKANAVLAATKKAREAAAQQRVVRAEANKANAALGATTRKRYAALAVATQATRQHRLLSSPRFQKQARLARRALQTAQARPRPNGRGPKPSPQPRERRAPRPRERRGCVGRNRGSRRTATRTAARGDPSELGDEPPPRRLLIGGRL